MKLTDKKWDCVTIAYRLHVGGKREDPESCSFLKPGTNDFDRLKMRNPCIFCFSDKRTYSELRIKYRVKSKKWESPEVAPFFLRTYYR